MTAAKIQMATLPRRFADLALLPHLLSVSKTVRQLLAIKLVELDVVVGQDQFLLSFEDDESIPVVEVAGRLSVRASTVSKMVDRLAEKGWAVRSSDDDDARRVRVELTEAGKAVREAVLALEAEVEAEVLPTLACGSTAVAALADLDAALTRRLRRLR